MRRLKSALSVTSPEIGPDEPTQFLTQDWLDEAMAIVRENFAKEDSSGERVPPLGLIRCSRGGKTRALKEIAKAVRKSMTDTAAIFVSFNDFTSMEDFEKSDLVTALCHRIAFAALKTAQSGPRSKFDNFRETISIDKRSIVDWLGDNKCVLLIDELNVGTKDAEIRELRKFYAFLKTHFLQPSGRYFVFSSHVVSTSEHVSTYMESVSERQVTIKELPVIRNLSEATSALELTEQLSAIRAIYNGLIPSLVLQPTKFDFSKRDDAADQCSKLENDDILKIMKSFVSGDRSRLPSELFPFMNTIEYKGVRWIPRHMHFFLKKFAENNKISKWMRDMLDIISDQFSIFENCNESDGKSWGKLFTIVILIRLLGGEFHGDLMPFAITSEYEVSYNSHKICGNLANCKNVREIKSQLCRNFQTYPHIAVIVPPCVRFEKYDLLIIIFESQHQEPIIYAYQCKLGNASVNAELIDEIVTKAFWINGQPRKKLSSKKTEWIVSTESQIKSFFGVSGNYWTPAVWRQLNKC